MIKNLKKRFKSGKNVAKLVNNSFTVDMVKPSPNNKVNLCLGKASNGHPGVVFVTDMNRTLTPGMLIDPDGGAAVLYFENEKAIDYMLDALTDLKKNTYYSDVNDSSDDIEISERDAELLTSQLQNTAEPNEALTKASERYKAEVDSGVLRTEAKPIETDEVSGLGAQILGTSGRF